MTAATALAGLRLVDDGTGRRRLAELVAPALRRNPRRAHLLVSPVLGKHVPAPPAQVLGAAADLAAAVRDAVGPEPLGLVLGYAETATALGHGVGAALGVPVLHSTRRVVEGVAVAARFSETHSHATEHALQPEDPALLADRGVVVLVDDEVSTGRTALATVTALQRVAPRERYVLAGLVDVRTAADRAAFAAGAAELEVRIDVISLAGGRIELAEDFAERAAQFVGTVSVPPLRRATPIVRRSPWDGHARDGGRHGFAVADGVRLAADAAATAASLVPAVLGGRVLVLGTEELMYAPLLLADALQKALGGSAEVRFSSTTRSPVVVLDDPGYPIRTAVRFPAHDGPADGPGERFAYNLAPAADRAPFTDVVVVTDDAGDRPELHAPDGLVAQVTATGSRCHLVVIPSYRPAAVAAGTP